MVSRLLAAWMPVLAVTVASATAPAREVHVVELRGMIHPVSASYLIDAIDRADTASAAALVIEMDTPGGLVSSTKEVAQRILAARTPVIGFVTPAAARASSGGFLLLLACDVAAMSPGTNTGAAHPVALGGQNTADDVELQKAKSDLAAFARSIAENRGRNVKAAESGVTEVKSWTEKEALEERLIDVIAADLEALAAQLEGRVVRRMDGTEITLALTGPRVRGREMTTVEQFQNFLLTPEIAAFLLLLGIMGLSIELSHPGLIVPGAVGICSLLLFAYAAHILPVNVLGLLLLALSVTLFVLEVKFASHGLLGTAGVATLVAGSLVLFNGPIPEMRLPLLFILPTSLAAGILMLLIARFVVRALHERVATGEEGMVGAVGIAATDLGPEGKVRVHGEVWNARADPPIAQGAKIRVRAVDDMWLVVEPERREP